METVCCKWEQAGEEPRHAIVTWWVGLFALKQSVPDGQKQALLTCVIRATKLGRKRMTKRTNERECEQARAGSGKMDKDKDDDRDKIARGEEKYENGNAGRV